MRIFSKYRISICLCYFYLMSLNVGYCTIISQGKLLTGETCYYHGHYNEDNICFTLGSNSLSWEKSEQSCRARGGTLVHNDSELTLGFLQLLMTTTGWQRSWLGGRKQSKQWQWFGGETLEEGSFMEWNELPSDENKDCVKVVPYKGYAWEDASCGQTHGYICETSTVSDLCEEASRIFYEVLTSSSRCFMFSHSHVAVNWFSAKKECERYGATLGHLNFQGIHDRLRRTEPGIQSNVNGYWIGATKAQWNWDYNISAASIDNFHWEDSQPNRSGNCLVLERFSGELYRWANWNCSDNINYMCQHDKLLLSEEETSTTRNSDGLDNISTSRFLAQSTLTSVPDTTNENEHFSEPFFSSYSVTNQTSPYLDKSTTAIFSEYHTPDTTQDSDLTTLKSDSNNTNLGKSTLTTTNFVPSNNLTSSITEPSISQDSTTSKSDSGKTTVERSTLTTISNNFTASTTSKSSVRNNSTTPYEDTSTISATHRSTFASSSTSFVQEQCYYIDLCWAVENHQEATKSNWSDVLLFLMRNIEVLQFSNSCFQISVLTYDRTVRKVINFKDSQDKDNLLDKIWHLPFLNNMENLNISTALNNLYRNIFSYDNGARRDAKKLVIFVKSGRSLLTDIDILAIDLALKLKSNGVHIGALTINSIVDKSEAENILNTIASHPAHIFQQHIWKYQDLHNETVSEKLLYLYQHVSSLLSSRRTTTTDKVLEKPTALPMEDESSTVMTVLLAAIVSFAILIVVITIIIGALLIKRRRQRSNLRSRIHMTTVSDKSLTTYEELANQSSISGYSTGSVKSTGSHGSSRQKIAKMKRFNRSTIIETEGGITTPWGSMRSSRRSHKRSPRSSIEHLTGGSWPAE